MILSFIMTTSRMGHKTAKYEYFSLSSGPNADVRDYINLGGDRYEKF